MSTYSMFRKKKEGAPAHPPRVASLPVPVPVATEEKKKPLWLDVTKRLPTVLELATTVEPESPPQQVPVWADCVKIPGIYPL